MKESGFWFVWNEHGSIPRRKHDSYESAVGEAERLARLAPGDTFVVLASVCARKVDAMQRINMSVEAPRGCNCDIPF